MATLACGVALVATGAALARAADGVAPPRAASESSSPVDAQLLLDLDLLRDPELTQRRSLLERLRVIESLRLLERLNLFEAQTAAPARPVPVAPREAPSSSREPRR